MSERTHNNKETTSDEIDLIELINVLWDKKWWIVLSAFVCTAIAGVYAFTAKEQWTSKAEIIAPRILDLNDYFTLRKEYARIVNIDFNLDSVINNLYSKFEQLAYSLDEREEFFSKSEIYKSLTKNSDEIAKNKFLYNLARKNIIILKSDPKKNPDNIGRIYSFVADNPQIAQTTLSGFIKHINKKAFNLDIDEFNLIVVDKLRDLKFEYMSIQQNINVHRDMRLSYLSNAYEIAKKLGIKGEETIMNNIKQNSLFAVNDKSNLSGYNFEDSLYLAMLGENYIQAQIDILNKQSIPHPPRFFQVKRQINELEIILDKIKNVNANTYSYLSSPDYPIEKDRPKRVLILFIGFILGLIVSSIIILFLSFFRKNNV